jgi:hypothetical protein
MNKKHLTAVLLALFCLMVIPSVAQATTITSCTFDKTPYYPGQTGFITVAIQNTRSEMIRVSDLTASIDYYYTDQVVYSQTFFTNATLPVEVQAGGTALLYIPFSLPTNIAPGVTQMSVRASTDFWHNSSQSWYGSDYPSFTPTLYIESPYKPQWQDLQATNSITTIMMYALGFTTLAFAVIVIFLMVANRRAAAAQAAIAAAA